MGTKNYLLLSFQPSHLTVTPSFTQLWDEWADVFPQNIKLLKEIKEQLTEDES